SLPKAPGTIAIAEGDFDGDGRGDLVLFSGKALRLWKNAGGLQFKEDEGFAARCGKIGGSSGVLADFLGSLSLSLLVLDPAAATDRRGQTGRPGGRPPPWRRDRQLSWPRRTSRRPCPSPLKRGPSRRRARAPSFPSWARKDPPS